MRSTNSETSSAERKSECSKQGRSVTYYEVVALQSPVSELASLSEQVRHAGFVFPSREALRTYVRSTLSSRVAVTACSQCVCEPSCK